MEEEGTRSCWRRPPSPHTDTHLVKAVRINTVIDLHVRSLSEAPVYSSFYTPRSIRSCRGEGGSRAGDAFVSGLDSHAWRVGFSPTAHLYASVLPHLPVLLHSSWGRVWPSRTVLCILCILHAREAKVKADIHAYKGVGRTRTLVSERISFSLVHAERNRDFVRNTLSCTSLLKASPL